METKETLIDELQVIEKWEKEQSGLWFWERITRLPFKILDKITPKIIHEKIGLLLEEMGSYLQTGGKYLIQEKQLLKTIQKNADVPIESIQDVSTIPLAKMKQISQQISDKRVKVAAIQGASTGFGGLFTLAIDIPALLGLSLKTLQEIAIIYGFDPNDKNERVFIIKCLQFTSSDIVGKEAILKELSSYYKRESQRSEAILQLQGWREVIYTYRDQFGWKKLFQMVPVAGLLFGAFTNRSMIKDIAEVGDMLYRKRRILERINIDRISLENNLEER
ncbi:EcsC family protein [Bacillus sp. CGMCC 1.16607]|uniref:EcsC family protein n=1 Tax=Bacillus sp. CGMCC 1.16607 TaxID=3351842 RepID=UPI0036449640